MNPRQARALITLAFAGALIFIAWGFFVPLILGAAIALLLHPLFDYLVIRKTWRADLTAVLLTVGVTVLLIFPGTLLSIRGIRFVVGWFQNWRSSPFFSSPGTDFNLLESVGRIPIISSLLNQVADLLHMDAYEVLVSAGEMTKNVGLRMADSLTTVLSSIPALAAGIFLLILSVYFFLADGYRVVRFFRANSFFPPEQTEEIFMRFKELCRAVLLASLVSGLAQAFIYFIGGAIAGVGDLLILSFSVFLASFIPVVGSSPITFGLGLYFIFSGSKFAGVTLLIAALVASLVDGIIRPMVLKGGANLHPFIAIIALFGGLQIFGFAGVFIGPIVAGMFFVVLDAHVKARGSD